MKVYDLSYSEYRERVTYLFLKILSNKEEGEVEELYNLLTAYGSDFFLDMLDMLPDSLVTRVDSMCYFLLFSVRCYKEIACDALNIAVEIAQEILGEMANEKRK